MPSYPELNQQEIEIMKMFTQSIAEFTKNGRPTDNNVSWPAFKPGEGASMLIESPMKVSRKLPFESLKRPGRMQFWMDLFNHTETLQSDYTIHDEL